MSGNPTPPPDELPDPWRFKWGERTRFLGDAYQKIENDNPNGPVKKLALVQTPTFVGQFLLDRTTPLAADDFGLDEDFRVIDPTCGTGHMLCQVFDRLWGMWLELRPDLDTPAGRLELSLIIVNCNIHGVDLDPLCVQIARLRLIVAACDAAGVLPYGAWGHRPNVAWGDALLDASDPFQPFFRVPDCLRPNYGDYRTASMMTEQERAQHLSVVERLAKRPTLSPDRVRSRHQRDMGKLERAAREAARKKGEKE